MAADGEAAVIGCHRIGCTDEIANDYGLCTTHAEELMAVHLLPTTRHWPAPPRTRTSDKTRHPDACLCERCAPAPTGPRPDAGPGYTIPDGWKEHP